MREVTISEAAEFIKSNCLKDWNLNDIKYETIRAINNNSLIYSLDADENLIGICLGIETKEIKVLHIKAIVAKGQFKKYIAYFKQRFPGYTLTYFRGQEFKTLKFKH